MVSMLIPRKAMTVAAGEVDIGKKCATFQLL